MFTIKKKRTLLLVIIGIISIVGMSSSTMMRWMYPIYHYDEISSNARIYDIDPMLLAAVVRIESKFQSDNVSHAGAIGLMQLMPDTATWIAEQSGIVYNSPQELAEPAINIRLGSWYMAYLQKRFKGNLVASIAAYNAGPSRVDAWITGGVWDGTLEKLDQIPVGETRHYVQRVLYSYDKYKNIYK